MADSSSSVVPLLVSLSQDELFSILLLLPVDSILLLALTCKHFKSLACSDSLWKHVCQRDWGQACVDAIKSSLKRNGGWRSNISWLEVYKQVALLDSVRCRRLDCVGSEPTPRVSHSLNFVSDCLVLFGGGHGGGRLNDTWVAYVGNSFQHTLKWQKIDSRIPTGRAGHTCVVLDDYLVLFGGTNDDGLRQNDTWIGKIECNIATGITLRWKLLDVGPCMPPPRGGHAACCISNNMVVQGGIGLSGVRLGDTWMLDLSLINCSGRWHEIFSHSAPPARSGHSLTSIGGSKAVLFGGVGLHSNVFGDVWLIDMSTTYLNWVKVCCEQMNTPAVAGYSPSRVGHSATLILGGRVLIHGGEGGLRRKENNFLLLDINAKASKPIEFNSKWSNPKTGIWKLLKPNGYTTNLRAFHRACADRSGHHLYVFGAISAGRGTAVRFDNEIFVVDLLV